MAKVVEELVCPVIDGTEPIPQSLLFFEEEHEAEEAPPIVMHLTRQPSASRPGAGLSKSIAIKISSILAMDLDAAQERAGVLGMTVSRDQLAESAINKMLDVMESLPPTSFCAVCTESLTGAARHLPLGKNGDLVWVCWTCDTEHPRKGRYAFAGGRSADLRDATNARSNGHIGDGNKRSGIR